jgi:hypothetical protein
MSDLLETVGAAAAYSGQAPSAEAWFAGGERVGYDPKAHTIFAREDVAREDAPLRVLTFAGTARGPRISPCAPRPRPRGNGLRGWPRCVPPERRRCHPATAARGAR